MKSNILPCAEGLTLVWQNIQVCFYLSSLRQHIRLVTVVSSRHRLWSFLRNYLKFSLRSVFSSVSFTVETVLEWVRANTKVFEWPHVMWGRERKACHLNTQYEGAGENPLMAAGYVRMNVELFLTLYPPTKKKDSRGVTVKQPLK